MKRVFFLFLLIPEFVFAREENFPSVGHKNFSVDPLFKWLPYKNIDTSILDKKIFVDAYQDKPLQNFKFRDFNLPPRARNFVSIGYPFCEGVKLSEKEWVGLKLDIKGRVNIIFPKEFFLDFYGDWNFRKGKESEVKRGNFNISLGHKKIFFSYVRRRKAIEEFQNSCSYIKNTIDKRRYCVQADFHFCGTENKILCWKQEEENFIPQGNNSEKEMIRDFVRIFFEYDFCSVPFSFLSSRKGGEAFRFKIKYESFSENSKKLGSVFSFYPEYVVKLSEKTEGSIRFFIFYNSKKKNWISEGYEYVYQGGGEKWKFPFVFYPGLNWEHRLKENFVLFVKTQNGYRFFDYTKKARQIKTNEGPGLLDLFVFDRSNFEAGFRNVYSDNFSFSFSTFFHWTDCFPHVSDGEYNDLDVIIRPSFFISPFIFLKCFLFNKKIFLFSSFKMNLKIYGQYGREVNEIGFFKNPFVTNLLPILSVKEIFSWRINTKNKIFISVEYSLFFTKINEKQGIENEDEDKKEVVKKKRLLHLFKNFLEYNFRINEHFLLYLRVENAERILFSAAHEFNNIWGQENLDIEKQDSMENRRTYNFFSQEKDEFALNKKPFRISFGLKFPF